MNSVNKLWWAWLKTSETSGISATDRQYSLKALEDSFRRIICEV